MERSIEAGRSREQRMRASLYFVENENQFHCQLSVSTAALDLIMSISLSASKYQMVESPEHYLYCA